MFTRLFTHTATAIAALCLLAPTASADAEADFFTGKTITILSPFGASGGYGRTTTLLARHGAITGLAIPVPKLVPVEDAA